jgi:AcrR family transcriptional regulator
MTSRNPEAPERTADRILDAAVAVLGDAGQAGFSLREVARRVGITPMAVYRHYDGVDALLAAVRGRASAALLAAFTDALAEPDPRARLEATARGYVRWAMANPEQFRLLFTGGPPPAEAAREAQVRRDAAAFRFIVDRMREAMAAGLLPSDDPEARAVDLWALMHGLVVLQQEGKLRLDPAAFESHVGSALRWLLR